METPWKLILLRCGCCTGVHCSTYCACSSLLIKFWGYKHKPLRMITSLFIYIWGWFPGFYPSNLQYLRKKFWIILRDIWEILRLIFKVRIFWEGQNFLWNLLYCRFVLFSNGQIYSEDFANICGLLRIYELFKIVHISILRF